MSDVTIAPNASPPPVNEVPVDPNPVSTPQPIGSQAPDKPESSRRESIQKAFDKAAERPKPEPRKAKMGDNNPPEPMEREKQKPKEQLPLDLKKRPDDQPQPRDKGKFAPRERDEEPATQAQPAQPAQYKELPAHEPYRDPPTRMTPLAKADWHATPVNVRSDIHRMHQEYAQAYQAYRADHEVMNSIRPFHQMAQEHGTTLDRALSNYVSMEQKLRSDVIGGLDIIINNLNLRTPDGQKLGSRDVAWHIINQSPDQHKILQNQNAQTAQRQQIGQLHSMVNTLAQGIGQMQYERRFAQTRSKLDEYAAQHPRFDELGDLIEREVKLGFDLDTARRRAELLRPATTAAQTRTTTAQTRNSDRSIHGAPGSANGVARRPDKPVGRREALERAFKRAGNSL